MSVFLDGSFAFGISRMVAMAHDVVPGREISAEEIEHLRDDDAVERAHSAALNYLSYRPRSRREIEIYFGGKHIEPSVAEAVLARLERAGLVDDAAFARFWVDNRQSFRPRGSRALRLEMRQKGLSTEVIDDVLETMGEEDELAYEAALKKVRSFKALDDQKFFQKMVGFLQRRGFPFDAASAATRRLLGERGDPENSRGHDSD